MKMMPLVVAIMVEIFALWIGIPSFFTFIFAITALWIVDSWRVYINEQLENDKP